MTFHTRALTAFAPYILVTVLHVVLVGIENPLAAPTKLLLMPLLIIAALWGSSSIQPWPRRALTLLSAALLASWVGDGAKTFLPWLPELPVMLLFFGIAHLIYMFMFWRTPGIATQKYPPLWSIVFAAWWVVLVLIIGPNTENLLIPVMLYGLVLGGTATLASRCGPIITWGGVWFLVSDTILAFRIFLPDALPEWSGAAVMFTYCLGQGLIIYGVIRALHVRASAV